MVRLKIFTTQQHYKLENMILTSTYLFKFTNFSWMGDNDRDLSHFLSQIDKDKSLLSCPTPKSLSTI